MLQKSSTFIAIISFLAIIPGIVQAAPGEGVLIKGASEKVYVIENGLKRWIKTAEIFNKLGYSWANIFSVSNESLNNIPPGKNIASTYQYPDGTLLKGNGPPVYLIEKGLRRWIPNPQVFEANGFRWGNIVQISDKILNRIKGGKNIPTNHSNNRPQTFILSGPCQQYQTTVPEIQADQVEFKYSGSNSGGNATNLSFETFLDGYDKSWRGSWNSYTRKITLPAENKTYTFYVRTKTLPRQNGRGEDGYYDTTPAFCKFTTSLSPYYQQIEISSVSGKSSDPTKEQITIKSRWSSGSINITGWTISTSKTIFTIPGAVKLFHPDSMFNFPRDLILESNERITIYGGKSPIGVSAYKLNKCERYFGKSTEYKNCFYENNQYPDFLKSEWRIYLNQGSEFLANNNEEIILKDKNGLVVDRYSY